MFSSPALAAGPWKGKIIDIETKGPLEGAVVLAVWERVYRTPAGPNSYFYEAKETLTDKEGRFEISAYSPINLLPIISYIRGPSFTFFKPGYLSLSSVDFGEFFLEGAREAPLERKEIGGKIYRLAPGILELPRLETREERIISLNSVEGFPIGYAPAHKIRKLLELIDMENKKLGFRR
ncbi:MAG: hypothetical protein M0Z67_08805 [Nitrospiraceae bacterium]|nr:hypothetical protein [Nitrospiraceae bacterium]